MSSGADYTLVITSVTMEDDAKFQCQVFQNHKNSSYHIAVHALVDLLTVPLKNDLKVGAAENSPAIQSQTATVTVEVRSKL